MIRQAEIFRHLDAIETIANDHVIPFLANVAKTLVTLSILAIKGLIKVSYMAAIFATNRVVNKNQEQNINHESTEPTDANRETDVPISVSISEDSDDTIDTQVEPAIDTSDQIIHIVQSINLVKPYTNPNSIENFVSNGLKDKLSENYLAATTYRLPNNKRVKTKTHVRHLDLGVMKEHYPILMATGVLR